MQDEILTVKETAEYLRVKPITIYKLCKEGKIPACKIGFLWRIKKSEIEKWIDWCKEHVTFFKGEKDE